jgi:hypothetical protein
MISFRKKDKDYWRYKGDIFFRQKHSPRKAINCISLKVKQLKREKKKENIIT